MTGPCSRANASASAALTAPPVPGSTGTSAARARSRDRALSPNSSSSSGRGPVNASPAEAQRAANSAFSLRNPYPGCTAVAPVSFAAAMSASASR